MTYDTMKMKLDALEKALGKAERPEVFVENGNASWKLQCYCFDTIEFSFCL